MSTALAIAGVTAVLRDLLNDGLINHNISGVLGSSVTVSVQAPDRVVAANAAEASQLNLFMYMVTPNLGWRNEGLPGRDGSGRTRLTNPPLAVEPTTGEVHLRHHISPSGYYRGKKVAKGTGE